MPNPTISASTGFGGYNPGWSYDDEQYLKALQSEYNIRKQHGIGLDWVEEAIKKNQELKAAGQKGTGGGVHYRNDINNAPVDLQGANPGEYSKELQDYIASKSGGFNPYANLIWNFDTRTFTLKQPQSTPATAPIIQNPLTPAATPNVQMPQVNKSPAINTSNLTQAYQNQNQITTPTNPAIQLPQQFQQNFNATPSITPPGSPQAIKMPNFNRNAGFSTNWSDLFSVANNRYTR